MKESTLWMIVGWLFVVSTILLEFNSAVSAAALSCFMCSSILRAIEDKR